MNARRRTVLLTAGCVLLLALAAGAYFAPLLVDGRCFAARDHYLFHHPRRFFAAEQMTAGAFPLWNPYLACGVPFFANLQSSVLYPPALLYYLAPFSAGYAWFVVFHYFLGSFAMFALMRQWGCRRPGSLLAALVFAYGGYLTSINDNLSFVTAGVWLPLVLLCQYRAHRCGSRRWWLAAGSHLLSDYGWRRLIHPADYRLRHGRAAMRPAAPIRGAPRVP